MDKGQFLLYQTPDGDSLIEVKLQNDTVWLSLDQMAELFQRNKVHYLTAYKECVGGWRVGRKRGCCIFCNNH